MSAIASFYLLHVGQLQELILHAAPDVNESFSTKATDRYWDYLKNNSTELKSFDGSGYLYANLFMYLEEEKNINLLTNQYNEVAEELVKRRGISQLLFTHNQQILFSSQLHPSRYSAKEIQQFNEEFSGEGDEETAQLMLEAIELLHENLCRLKSEEQILLLIIG